MNFPVPFLVLSEVEDKSKDESENRSLGSQDAPRSLEGQGKIRCHMQEEFGHNDRWNMPCPS